MTSAHFDAPASNTRRRPAAFLMQPLVRHSIPRRIDISLRTFYRDIATLRDAGLYIAAEPNNYHMTCFVSDTDAA